jgi:activator of HSP90 ATPase
MFLYRRSLLGLAVNTTRQKSRLTLARYNSSFRDNKESQVSQTDDTTTAATNKKEQEDQEQQQHISFMPVINIPETELAHNAFFSLHRPLLGLSDKHERSFFSNRQELDESRKFYGHLCFYC